MTEVAEPYFSLLDDFASELGSTLDDLAVDWEDHVVPEERTRSDLSLSSEVADSTDEFGKRMAKPLSFYNPVYSMVHTATVPQKAKRPTLVPLPQLNGGTNQGDGSKVTKKEAKAHKHKKNGNKKFGIISKINAVARRHSGNKHITDPPLSGHDKKRQSDGGVGVSSDVSSSSNLSTIQDDPVTVINRPVSELKKSNRIPPQKSPRLSKIGDSNHAQKNNKVVSDEKTLQPEFQRPVQLPKNPVNPIVTVENEGASPEIRSDSMPSTPNKITKSPDYGGSIPSLSSMSDDGPPSDIEVKTMEDVISEVAREEENLATDTPPLVENDKNTAEKPDENVEKSREFVEKPGKLRRDKTLRWTGTRKAPGLVREFTRRHKTMIPDMYSSTEELQVLERKPNHKISTPTDSRSCTPSQQTTSFGMGDDYDASDEVNDDMSESDHSDNLAVFTPSKSDGNNKLTKPETAKSPSNRDSAFIVLSSLLPPAPRLRRTQSSKVRAYLQKLGSNTNNALGYAVTQFVEETMKNVERRPLVLVHDVRSFLSDIKNYFISNPHIGLAKKIDKIVSKSASVDVDGAVDDALDRLVLYPLHDTIYRCLVIDYKETGQLAVMQEAMAIAKRKTAQELGVRKTLIPPDAEAMGMIKNHFIQLQRTYSPYFKLKELLAAVTRIYQSTKDLTVEDQSARNLGADDFLPLLVYAIVYCDFIAADIETQYMDGLLEPALLLGEGGYYLTTLISAIQVVISIQRKEAALPNISDLQGFLKVGISPSESHPYKKSETNDSEEEVVLHKTLHVPPAMTAQNLCDMISKKFNVAIPQNYCLHVMVNGVPHALRPNDCPQLVKMDLLTQFPSNSFYFSFQRRGDPLATQISKASSETMLVSVDQSGFVTNKTEAASETTELLAPEERKSPVPYIEIENSETNQNSKYAKDINNGGDHALVLLKATDVDNDENTSLQSIKANDAKDINDNEFCITTPDLSVKDNCTMTYKDGVATSDEESDSETRLDSYIELTKTSSSSTEAISAAENADNVQTDSTADEQLISSDDNAAERLSDIVNHSESEESTAEIVDVEIEQRIPTPIPVIEVDTVCTDDDDSNSTSSNETDKPDQSNPLNQEDNAALTRLESPPKDTPDADLPIIDELSENSNKTDKLEDDESLTRLESPPKDTSDTNLPVIVEVNENASNEDETFAQSRSNSPHEDALDCSSAINVSSRPGTPRKSTTDLDVPSAFSSRSQSPNDSIHSFAIDEEKSIVTFAETSSNDDRDDAMDETLVKDKERSVSPVAGSSGRKRSQSSPRIERLKSTFDTSDAQNRLNVDGDTGSTVSTELSPGTSRRSNAIRRRSRTTSSNSSGVNSAINSPNLDTQLHRRSCMPKDSVASLTEFFESKKSIKQQNKHRSMPT